MKTYSSLSIDVIHFEAQDVITTSTPDVVTCICPYDCFSSPYYLLEPNGTHAPFCDCKADNHPAP